MPVQIITDLVTPHECYHHHAKQLFNPADVLQVSALDIESARFQAFEKRLDLPTFPIIEERLFVPVEADDHQQFRSFVPLPAQCRREVAIAAVDFHNFRIMHGIPDSQAIEQPADRDGFPLVGQQNLEIVADADVIPDALAVEVPDPLLPDGLPVGHDAIDTFLTENLYKPDDQGYPFFTVRVALLVQHSEHQRESHIAVGNAEHEDVDVLLSELPVGAVDDQFETRFFG